jgi:hypothetical protein
MKTLYTFKVGKPTFEEIKSVDAEGKEVITKNKALKSADLFIKKPSHREVDEMDLFYSIQISDLQSKGVSTNTMILNSYQESGGLDSKKEVEAMKKLINDLNLKRNELFKNHVDKINNPALLEEVKDLSIQLQDYQSRLASVFDRSAESIAERRVVLWATLFMIHTKEGDTYSPVFSGKTYEEKLNRYYDILDSESEDFEFEKAVFEKGQIFMMTWLKKQAETEEDFKLLESIIDGENTEDAD